MQIGDNSMNENLIKISIGFDQREAVAYHTFCQSIIQNTTKPVLFLHFPPGFPPFYVP